MAPELITLENARQVRDDLGRRLIHETDAARRDQLMAAWSAAGKLCAQLVALDPEQHRLVRVWTEADYDRAVAAGWGHLPVDDAARSGD